MTRFACRLLESNADLSEDLPQSFSSAADSDPAPWIGCASLPAGGLGFKSLAGSGRNETGCKQALLCSSHDCSSEPWLNLLLSLSISSREAKMNNVSGATWGSRSGGPEGKTSSSLRESRLDSVT
jgi:hypothetical protein